MRAVAEFLAMGGYAFYVWTSYGLALVVLIANVVLPWRRERAVRRRLARRLRLEHGEQLEQTQSTGAGTT